MYVFMNFTTNVISRRLKLRDVGKVTSTIKGGNPCWVDMSPEASASKPVTSAKPIKDHKNISNSKLVFISLASGATAGAIAKTTIAPLDRCKISFQIHQDKYNTRAAVNFLKNVYQTEGFFALWRGNSATMARILPYAAVQFTAHEQWKRVLGVDGRVATNPDNLNVSFRRFLAGSLAGVTSQSLTYPLDLARARMAVTHKEQFRSLREVFIFTSREEGLMGFYRGYIPTILGVIPYAGASFCTYESLKAWYTEVTGGKSATTTERLAFGAMSGVCGQSVSYPLDIVRRRMQTSVITGREYKTVIGSLSTIYREEGIKNGFFKGLSMNWIKGPVAVGISFATYDRVKEFLFDVVD